jgi:hypothetical protein
MLMEVASFAKIESRVSTTLFEMLQTNPGTTKFRNNNKPIAIQQA